MFQNVLYSCSDVLEEPSILIGYIKELSNIKQIRSLGGLHPTINPYSVLETLKNEALRKRTCYFVMKRSEIQTHQS